MKKILTITLLTLSLAACQTSNQGIGAAIGGGDGKLLSIGVGAILGTVIGSKVGDSMAKKEAPKN